MYRGPSCQELWQLSLSLGQFLHHWILTSCSCPRQGKGQPYSLLSACIVWRKRWELKPGTGLGKAGIWGSGTFGTLKFIFEHPGEKSVKKSVNKVSGALHHPKPETRLYSEGKRIVIKLLLAYQLGFIVGIIVLLVVRLYFLRIWNGKIFGRSIVYTYFKYH